MYTTRNIKKKYRLKIPSYSLSLWKEAKMNEARRNEIASSLLFLFF